MTCRCSSPEEHARRAREQRARSSDDAARSNAARVRTLEADIAAMTVKAEQYEIVQSERVAHHLVLMVRYPSCTKCDFEGNKIMVFLDVTETATMRWRRIDPHFRNTEPQPTEAPSPAARFPATDKGWKDAIQYAKRQAGLRGE